MEYLNYLFTDNVDGFIVDGNKSKMEVAYPGYRNHIVKRNF